MFYDRELKRNQDDYKRMLKIVGSLSQLFSESDKPFLYYRCHENIFCKYFGATNIGREDCAFDAKKNNTGIGLKTWVGSDNQKIAEFNKLQITYQSLEPLDMVKKIAEYRNERIRVAINIHGTNNMIYHIVKRIPSTMLIYECSLDYINIDKITLMKKKSSDKNIYFKDDKHMYHFNISKSTLYMMFDDMELLDTFVVDILEDPYSYLDRLFDNDKELLANIEDVIINNLDEEKLCLRLYTENKKTNEKVVQLHSGLNQWNGSRGNKSRNVNELYIPYPKNDRDRSKGFFPPINESFELYLPDGTILSAKVCQQDGKAIMSNPNSALGKWLLRDVFALPEKTVVTYEMLEVFGIDSVIFTKLGDKKYRIDFTELGTYERLLNENE